MLAGGMGPQMFVTISQRSKILDNSNWVRFRKKPCALPAGPAKLGSFRRIAGTGWASRIGFVPQNASAASVGQADVA